MSEFISELKAAWVGNRQRAFYQSTRAIMMPEERRALEDEFERRLAEHDRQVAERALIKAARELRVSFSRGAAIAMHHQCHKRQCKCGNPGNDEIVREVFDAARASLHDLATEHRKGESQ